MEAQPTNRGAIRWRVGMGVRRMPRDMKSHRRSLHLTGRSSAGSKVEMVLLLLRKNPLARYGLVILELRLHDSVSTMSIAVPVLRLET